MGLAQAVGSDMLSASLPWLSYQGTSMRLRPYTPADRATCLGLFQSNLPDILAPEHFVDFQAHLDALPGPYYVLENSSGVVVACGGFRRAEQPRQARLSWGIVGRPWHRLGYGHLLLFARLSRLTIAYPDVERIEFHIGHHFASFFESAGFSVDRVTEDGYGPGRHRYDFSFDLGPAGRAYVARRLEAIARQTGYKD